MNHQCEMKVLIKVIEVIVPNCKCCLQSTSRSQFFHKMGLKKMSHPWVICQHNKIPSLDI